MSTEQTRKYNELSKEERVALYKEYNTGVNLHTKASVIVIICSGILGITGCILNLCSHWTEELYSKILNAIGSTLFLFFMCVMWYFMGLITERYKRFFIWLEREKSIAKK